MITSTREGWTCRTAYQPINTLVAVTLQLAPAGHVEIAEAIVNSGDLGKIREARLVA